MYTYRATSILKVVDGDTIACEITVGFGWKALFRFRVAHIDAVEKGEPLGLEATEFTDKWMRDCLQARKLLVTTMKESPSTVGVGDGSFGRWLGDFHADGVHLSGLLLNAGYAVYSK